MNVTLFMNWNVTCAVQVISYWHTVGKRLRESQKLNQPNMHEQVNILRKCRGKVGAWFKRHKGTLFGQKCLISWLGCMCLYVLVYYSYVVAYTRTCTCMLLACYSYVLVSHSYLTRMYSYVLVCTRMYSCGVLVTIDVSQWPFACMNDPEIKQTYTRTNYFCTYLSWGYGLNKN